MNDPGTPVGSDDDDEAVPGRKRVRVSSGEEKGEEAEVEALFGEDLDDLSSDDEAKKEKDGDEEEAPVRRMGDDDQEEEGEEKRPVIEVSGCPNSDSYLSLSAAHHRISSCHKMTAHRS